MAAAAVDLSDPDPDPDSRKYLWNACEVLEIEPLGHGYTCIGKEVTKGGCKCTLPLEKKTCDLAEDLLNEIQRTNMAEKTPTTHQLQEIAGLLLCRGLHQYQAAEKARDWMVKIREHSQGLKESSAEISSSDIQAMKTELGQIKSQLALMALKYSNLREKHAAVLYENKTLRQGQIKQRGVEGLSALLDQILLIFANDPTLQPLFASALRNDGHGVMRCGSDIHQCLREFGIDLRDEVQGEIQKNIALIIRMCANDLAVAISSQFNEEDSIGSELNQQGKLYPAGYAQLLKLFCSLESRGVRIPLGLGDKSNLSYLPDATTPAAELDRYPNSGVPDWSLPGLKQLIVESRAFVTLRQHLEQIVHQKCGISTSTISYAMDNDRVIRFIPWIMAIRPGYIDRIKRKLEMWVRSPVIWWPLQPPKLFCPDGYIRITWACVSFLQ